MRVGILLTSLCLLATAVNAQTYNAIVIGAGMSGAACARKLANAGKKVLVLEGRDRSGGRTWTKMNQTINVAGTPRFNVEMGAQWVQGINSAPDIITLATNAKVSLSSSTTNYDAGEFVWSNGTTVTTALDDAYYNLYTGWETYILNAQNANAASTTDPGLKKYTDAYIASKSMKGDTLLGFKYELNVEVEHETGGSIANSSLWYDESNYLNGGDKFVTGGYQKMVEYLLNHTNIVTKLNTTVKGVDYSKAGTVNVTTTASGTFTAPYAVVTVPLGVLKAGTITFKPTLPAAKTTAISRLKMGMLHKTVLVWKTNWWKNNTQILSIISKAGDGAWEECYSQYREFGVGILVCFNAGDYGWKLDAKSDADVVAEALTALRAAFPTVTITNPLWTAVSHWGQDPFSRGAYSYLAQGAYVDDNYYNIYGDLRTPVKDSANTNRVFFAGEHTRADYPALTQGAYISGTAAADLISPPSG